MLSKAESHGWTPEMLARAAQRYAEVLPVVRDVARALGYAIAVHGSQSRDLDLIAVPWTEDAVLAEALVEFIRHAVDGFMLSPHPDADPNDFTRRNPQPKPHGRLAWSIHLGATAARGQGGDIDDVHLYLDLSVMPRKESV